MVPKRGLEPPRPDGHYTLNVARLPIPPLRQVWPSPRPDERQGKGNRFCLGLKDFIFPLGRCSVKKVHGVKGARLSKTRSGSRWPKLALAQAPVNVGGKSGAASPRQTDM